jgi:hypothetical protein
MGATGKLRVWQLEFRQCGSGSGDSECNVGKPETTTVVQTKLA